MLVEFPMWLIATTNIIAWPVIQLTLAWTFTRMPTHWFSAPRSRAFENNGKFYEQSFSIKSWKDQLPDAASWFSGGFAKAHLKTRDQDHIKRFIQETWRGELCHWSALAFIPLFFLFNPWWGDLIIVAYAILANLPCILVQRYNRARLLQMLKRAALHS